MSGSNMSDFDLQTYCANTVNETVLADCYLYNAFTSKITDLSQGVNVFFLVVMGAVAFLRPAGFTMIWAGMVREKNVVNIVIKSLIDSSAGCIAFWALGYAFAFGGADPAEKTFIGNQNFFTRNYNQGFDEFAHFYFQMVFAQTAATIVTGVLAERTKMSGFFWWTSFITSFVYPVIVHSVWSKSGYLSPTNSNPFRGVGAIDFAGAGAVHMLGGYIGLLAAIILGPRRGRFHDENGKLLETPTVFRYYSPSFMLLGTFIIWVGWIGVNPGSAGSTTQPDIATGVALSAVTTTLSGATAAISAILIDTLIEARRTGHFSYDITMACNGCISGLVAVTACCAVISTWAAVLIGLVAGWVYYFGDKLLTRLKIDDCSRAIPVHFCNGVWSLLATGLFANPYYMDLAGYNGNHGGWFYSWGRGSGDANLLLAQFCLFLYTITWASLIMIPFFFALRATHQLRVTPEEEDRGLDYVHHRQIMMDAQGNEIFETDGHEMVNSFRSGSKHSRHSMHSSTHP